MNDTKPEGSEEQKDKRGYAIPVVIGLVILLLFVVIVMLINSKKPEYITLEDLDNQVKGTYFIKENLALIHRIEKNWMPNDIFWPTALLDNMPNFQIGELEVIRYNVRVLRDNLSRMRTTDKLDPNAEAAFTALSNDPYKWWFPSSESKWKLGHKNLETFHRNLLLKKSSFYPRADNLVQLLTQYVSLMGGVNTRLINAPSDISQTLSMEEQRKDSPAGPGMVDIDIAWYKIDNNFYYAQGVAYALFESFKAIRIDFIDVLTDKNCVNLVDKILENLKRSNFEPLIVFNGDPDSIFANHSLNLSGMFNDARQKINSLITALKQG